MILTLRNLSSTRSLSGQIISKLDKIKYIAAYVSAPDSKITHYAEVEEIAPYGEDGKYQLIFTEPAKQLEHPVKLGELLLMTMTKNVTNSKINNSIIPRESRTT